MNWLLAWIPVAVVLLFLADKKFEERIAERDRKFELRLAERDNKWEERMEKHRETLEERLSKQERSFEERLSKQERNFEEKQEKQEMNSEERFSRAMSRGNGRKGEIAWAIMVQVPSISKQSAMELAEGIDNFEDFNKLEKFKAYFEDGWLVVLRGSWRTRVHLSNIKEEHHDNFLSVVTAEMQRQEMLFPARSNIKRICEEHLLKFAKVGDKIMTPEELQKYVERQASSSQAAQRLQEDLARHFEAFFNDLIKNHIDVDSMLMASWAPLEMKYAGWAFGYLDSVVKNPSGPQWNQQPGEHSWERSAIVLWQFWEFSRSKKSAF